jgi:hypothetical protein
MYRFIVTLNTKTTGEFSIVGFRDTEEQAMIKAEAITSQFMSEYSNENPTTSIKIKKEQ